MLDFKKVLEPSYLFAVRPELNSQLVFLLSLAFGLAILASGFCWLFFTWREKTNPLLAQVRHRLVRWLFTTGFVGLLLMFFRVTGIPYFGMRLILLLWLIICLLWLLLIANYLLKDFPKERRLARDQSLRARYLPKQKARTR